MGVCCLLTLKYLKMFNDKMFKIRKDYLGIILFEMAIQDYF